MDKINSIDEIFGSQDFVKGLKVAPNTEDGLQNYKTNSYLMNTPENNLYIAITYKGNTKLYILEPEKKDEFNIDDKYKLGFENDKPNYFIKPVDANYKKSA